MSRNEISDLRLEEMGFVFQQMYMLKNLSVYDNIILPAYQSVKGRTKQGRKEILFCRIRNNGVSLDTGFCHGNIQCFVNAA